MKPGESLFFDIRGVRHHVRAWGRDGAPKLVMLHGWMDVSASFQFVVDALRHEWRVLAPDWRGFGLSAWTGGDAYWYPDYLADLDHLLPRLLGDEPATLVAHSMGGNVACIYAGVRPARVARLVNLEGLGLLDSDPAEAPERYARWLDELLERPQFREYASFEELAARLRLINPRLSEPRARFLSVHWGKQREDGRVVLRSDPAHKIVNPVLYRGAEVAACLRRITAPVLWVQGAQSDLVARSRLGPAGLAERKRCIGDLTDALVDDAGHMLHHDQPERVAALVEEFLERRA
jgi:pimeloyl-ACP methyl ester carboxylesterase